MEALLVIETVALNAPAAFGLKTKLIVELWPAPTTAGRLGALSEKYLLEMEALVMVTEAVPVFEAVAVSVLLVPASTLPKSRLAPLMAKAPDCCRSEDLLELNPWQPAIVARHRRASPRLVAQRPFAARGARKRPLMTIPRKR